MHCPERIRAIFAELELAAQRGVPQNKIEGEDLWGLAAYEFAVATFFAAPPDRANRRPMS